MWAQGGGWEREREACPINSASSWAHAWMSTAVLTHAVYTARKEATKTEVRAHARARRTCTWKEEETLYVWSGWKAFLGGRGGWSTVPGDQWKCWALPCHTCEKDLLLCENPLKAAVEIAIGVKNPTRHFTTQPHTFAKIQMQKSRKLFSSNLAQMEAITCYKFVQTHVILSCFNHRWLL